MKDIERLIEIIMEHPELTDQIRMSLSQIAKQPAVEESIEAHPG